MSEEILRIVVPVFTAVLGLFVGYFLNQALYERKRKDELEDRETERRAEIYHKRIQEAEAYLESSRKTILQLINIEVNILSSIGSQIENVGALEKLLDSSLSPKRLVSISLLNDPKLEELNSKLASGISSEIAYAYNLQASIRNNKPINKDAEVKRLTASTTNMPALINQMQMRLDKLAEFVR